MPLYTPPGYSSGGRFCSFVLMFQLFFVHPLFKWDRGCFKWNGAEIAWIIKGSHPHVGRDHWILSLNVRLMDKNFASHTRNPGFNSSNVIHTDKVYDSWLMRQRRSCCWYGDDQKLHFLVYPLSYFVLPSHSFESLIKSSLCNVEDRLNRTLSTRILPLTPSRYHLLFISMFHIESCSPSLCLLLISLRIPLMIMCKSHPVIDEIFTE